MKTKWEAYQFPDTEECVVQEVDANGVFVRWVAERVPTPALARRIAKLPDLEAIVDKLPKTADGRYWVPGQEMDFYHPREAGTQDDVDIEDGRWVAWWWTVDRKTGGSAGHFYDISECYSTRDVAESAREEAGS